MKKKEAQQRDIDPSCFLGKFSITYFIMRYERILIKSIKIIRLNINHHCSYRYSQLIVLI